MSDGSPGYSFGPTEQVTNTKLASLASISLNPSAISGRSLDTTVQNNDTVLYWQNSSSTLRQFSISALASLATAGLVAKNVTQTAHGFSVGNVLYWMGSAYAAAQANVITTSVVIGVVSFVTDGNNFSLAQAGVVTGLSGLVTGTQYYLSASVAGATTSTPPGAAGSYIIDILYALSSTVAILNISSPMPYSTGNQVCNGRLTLTSGTPVTPTDVTAAGTLYWTPYKGNIVSLYNGSNLWSNYSFAQQALTLSGLTANVPQDVFAFINSGAVTISNLAWSSSSTRSTALTYQDGIEVLTGGTAKRYLGTIYLNNANTTEDSVKNRLVYNRYNQVERPLAVTETTVSWAASGTTFRQSNGSAANTVNIVMGLAENAAEITAKSNAFFNSGFAAAGIGINTVTSNSAQLIGCFVNNTIQVCPSAYYNGILPVGFNAINWLEISTLGSGTFYGTDGTPALTCGMVAKILM